MRRLLLNLLFTTVVLAVLAWTLRGPARAWFAPAKAERTQGPHQHEIETRTLDSGIPGQRTVLYYQDPMHPDYKSNSPGTAPDCGMQLVAVYAEQANAGALPPGAVQVTPQKQQLIGVRTAKVERQRVLRTIRTVAQIQADETRIAHIHVKVSGWIEQVYVDFVGQLVKKGQPLFGLYSPELVSTQEEYLIARRGLNSLGSSPYPSVSEGAQSLLRAARNRLRLWDINDEQIKKLDETGQVMRTMTLYSPIDGFVLDRKAFPQVAVTPDMDLYTVADLSSVWAVADVYEYEVPYVRVGQPAQMRLDYLPGRTFSGSVRYINPQVDPQTRTIKVRLEFTNPRMALKPQMFSEVQLSVDYGVQTVIPQEAVLDSGTQQTVFLAQAGGYFEPRQIQTGARLDDRVIVLSGLRPGETIVTSANFLIDSESRLKSGMGGMKH